MKDKIPYKPFNKFVFRTPAFPLDYYKKIESAFSPEDDFFNEAVFISSPDLFRAKTALAFSKNEKEKRRIELSLYKYITRACTRCTPFGLMAGCSTGQIGEATIIRLLDRQSYRRVKHV